MKKTGLNFIVLAISFFPGVLFSGTFIQYEDINKDSSIFFNLALGYLAGESKEFVYDGDTGQKLSQLNWDIDRAAIIKGDIRYDYSTWLSASISGFVTLEKGDAVMDDYDWLSPNQSTPTDWSHHENTQLRYANDIDLNLTGWFLRHHNYKVGVLGGYKRSSFSFLAIGGCFRYNNGAMVGCFPPDEIGIGYQQKFESPYIGLNGEYTLNAFELSGQLKYGPWVRAKDVDQHYQRNLTFKELGRNEPFYSAVITAGYKINPCMKIFLEAAYNEFTHVDADTVIIDNTSGASLFLPDSAGLSNKNYYLALGVQYKPSFFA